MDLILNDTDNNLRIGIVLSSGGARGVFAHTGFLLALEHLGIKPVAIAGCSAGALVGGIYASGTGLDQWAARLANVHPRDYWKPDSMARFFWNMIIRKGRGYTGLSSTQTAIEFIRRNLTAQTFETCKIPFHSLAMNLSRGTKILFGEGELASRIMASAAIPVLYRPVKIKGEWFSDGATIELAPTDAICCKHSLDVLIVHHTAIHRDDKAGLEHILRRPWSLLSILLLQLYSDRPWYLSNKPVSETRCQCGCGALVVVLEPELPDLGWPLGGEASVLQESAMIQDMKLLGEQKSKWKKRKLNVDHNQRAPNLCEEE